MATNTGFGERVREFLDDELQTRYNIDPEESQKGSSIDYKRAEKVKKFCDEERTMHIGN